MRKNTDDNPETPPPQKKRRKNPGGIHRGMTKSGRKKCKPGPKKKHGPKWKPVAPADRNVILKLLYGGASQAEIGRALGRSPSTIRNVIKRHGMNEKVKAYEESKAKSVMSEADYERAKTVGIYKNVEAALANELVNRIQNNDGKTGVREEDTIRYLLAVGDQKLNTLGVDTSGRPREDDVPGGGGPGLTINIQNLVMMRETAKSMSPEELKAGIDRLKKSIGVLEVKEVKAVTVEEEQGGDSE